MNQNSLQITVNRITQILNSLNVRYHLTGGLISSYYGEPRFTQDIDFVISFSDKNAVQDLINKINGNNYFFDEQTIVDAIEHGSLFQVLDEETVIKIDFHVGESIENELGRSNDIEIFPGLIVPIVSKEDAILAKLLWVKKGSHKSKQDIRGMLFDKENINFDYLNKQIKKLNLKHLYDSIIEKKDNNN